MAAHPLLQTWVEHLTAAGALAEAVPEAFAQLVAAYQTPGRYYHTLEHVHHVLRTAESLADHSCELAAVTLAAWYHDAVYDARATDNEERSVDMARAALGALSIAPNLVERVAHLVLATKTHQTDGDADAAVLLDADLAILGAGPVQYDRYADQIRREYDWVPEPQYRAGRASVLQRFLDRPTIYRTPPMQAACENQARDNLRREIARLTAAV